jgi:hypothetical protein
MQCTVYIKLGKNTHSTSKKEKKKTNTQIAISLQTIKICNVPFRPTKNNKPQT